MSCCHARLLKLGLDTSPIAATQLLSAYAGLGAASSLICARRLFEAVPPQSRDPVLYAALASAYARAGLPYDALSLYSHFLTLGGGPNPFLLSSLASAAAAAGPALARSLHCHAISIGLHAHVVVATSLLSAYSKCDLLASACRLFDGMPHRNLITWNAMISAYSTSGMGFDALVLFVRLRRAESETGFDEFSVSSVFTACAGLGKLRFGLQVHGLALVSGLELDLGVKSSMANMYFRCGEVHAAKRLMEGRDLRVVDRLMMINGYVFNERYREAIRSVPCGGDLLRTLMVDNGVGASVVTACANLGWLSVGRKVHCVGVVLGYYDNVALGGALIDMYCKCSSIGEARKVFLSIKERQASHWNSIITGCMHCGCLDEARGYFDEMPIKNVISWTAMISGYVQFGFPKEALGLLAKLYREEWLVRGNCYTFASTLDACSSLAALDIGKQIHGQSLRTIAKGASNYFVLETALVDMYSKSGNLTYARTVFDRALEKNVVTWTSMITGYASHGYGIEAIEVLELMMSVGFKPNEITFVAILSACSRSGLIKQGMHYFTLMRDKFGIAPRGDHYACLIDMLGRDGKLEEAWKVVEEIKEEILDGTDNTSIWGALLAGCKIHGNVEIGNKVIEEMAKRKKHNLEAHITMSNVYADCELWNDVYRVREELKKQGVVKGPGQSQIQI